MVSEIWYNCGWSFSDTFPQILIWKPVNQSVRLPPVRPTYNSETSIGNNLDLFKREKIRGTQQSLVHNNSSFQQGMFDGFLVRVSFPLSPESSFFSCWEKKKRACVCNWIAFLPYFLPTKSWESLEQRWQAFCKAPYSKYFSLWAIWILLQLFTSAVKCSFHLITTRFCSLRQYVNEQAWLCPSQTLF